MLIVDRLPVVEPCSPSGWHMTFWLGDAFDFSIPFRETLEEIARLIGELPDRALTLPPFVPGEDFVEGKLRFGTHEVETYYEYCLGYLALSHASREPLDIIADEVRLALTVR